MAKHEFIEDNLIIKSKQTMDLLLKQKDCADLIALYDFYYYTAKWQGTNQPKASISYVAKGLGWGTTKARQRKQKLIELGLIEDARHVDEKTKKVKGWYVRVKYLLKSHPTEIERVESHPTDLPQGGSSHRVEFPEGNALRTNNINALRSNNKMLSNASVAGESVDKEIPQMINLFKDISPTNYQKWFANKTERAAAAELLQRYGLEKMEILVRQFLPTLNSEPYIPKDAKAFKPSELLRNFDKIIAKIKELKIREEHKSKTYVIS
jgi:hypothetical protein